MRSPTVPTRCLTAALVLLAAAGCSGDDSDTAPNPTRVTEDPQVAARAVMCDSLQSYVLAEGRRLRNPVEDQAVVTRLESQRSQALTALRSTLIPETPPSVRGALDQLAALPIQAGPDTTTPPPPVDTATPLAVVTGGLDPICDTQGGQARQSTTTTPPAPTTTAATGGGATSSTSNS